MKLSLRTTFLAYKKNNQLHHRNINIIVVDHSCLSHYFDYGRTSYVYILTFGVSMYTIPCLYHVLHNSFKHNNILDVYTLI